MNNYCFLIGKGIVTIYQITYIQGAFGPIFLRSKSYFDNKVVN